MDKRVEMAARAMARYRLGMDSFISSLNPDIVAKVRRSAEDKLWPSLVGEAQAMVEALDALEREPNARTADRDRADAPLREGGTQSSNPSAAVQDAGSRTGQVATASLAHGVRNPSIQVDDDGAEEIPAQRALSLDIGEQPAGARVDQVPITSAPPQEGAEQLVRAESGVTGKPAAHGELPLPPSDGQVEQTPPRWTAREGRERGRWRDMIAAAKGALQREAAAAPPADVKPESPVVQIPPRPAVQDVGERLSPLDNTATPRVAPEREPLSATSSGVNSHAQLEETAATATPALENGRDRQVDNAEAVKVTPQPDPPSDPATEALRSALAALAATGIPPRSKT
jgi:hypothetical protein